MVPNCDEHALSDIGEFNRESFLFLKIYSNPAIHRRGLSFDPFAASVDKSLLVGGDVKISGKNAVLRCGRQVCRFLLDDFSAMLTKVANDIIDDFRRGPEHIDAGVARVM